MNKATNAAFFLTGILLFAIYVILLKITPMYIEQVIQINSVSLAIITYGIIGLILFSASLFITFHYLKRESLEITNFIILIILFGILLFLEYSVVKSENLMINDFDIPKELRFKLLGIRAYIANGFKVLFFIVITLRFLKYNKTKNA